MVTPQGLLDHAEKLFDSAADDLGYRSVVERAYYSAFHAAREFEEALPHRSAAQSRTGTHDSLLQRLECPDTNLDSYLKTISKDVGGQLRQFKAIREIATYELKEPIRVDHAEKAILQAKDILAECSKGQLKIRALAGRGS